MTAVEWLVKKLSYETSDGTIISHHFIINKLVEQAKEMEKEQIIEFAENWSKEILRSDRNINIEQYYNETLNQNKMKHLAKISIVPMDYEERKKELLKL